MNILEKKVKIKELWQLCFHDDERFVSLLFDRQYRDENACCMEEKGVVTTALQMLPYRMTFGSTCLDVSYISGASTRPEYRNRGLMSRLLVDSFNTMSSRDIPLSALIPAEPWLYGYYASKGYAPVFFRKELNFTSAHRFNRGDYRRVFPLPDELYRFFDNRLRQRSCCVLHERNDFEVICQDIDWDGGAVVAVADDAGQLSAVAFAVPHDERVVVKELLAVDAQAGEAALHEVKELYPGLPMTLYTLPEEGETSLQRMGMMRIVDVPALLSVVAGNHTSLRVTIRVTDSLLPSNNGLYLIEGGKCCRISAERCDLDVDVAQLALLVFGDSKLSSLLDFPAVRPYMSLMLD